MCNGARSASEAKEMAKCGYRVAVIVVLSYALATNCQAYSGGTGEPCSPFEIATVADWEELMNTSTDWDKHFVLKGDIDMNAVTLSPIGNAERNFTGVLYGNNHRIRNVDINMPGSDYVGLFGYVGQNGAIRNIGIEDITIVGNDYVGGLVGRNEAALGMSFFGPFGLFKCHCTGSVSGGSYVGGLVGDNYGEVRVCYTTGSVAGNTRVGGLVGGSDEDNIPGQDVDSIVVSACYSTVSVSGGSYIGGLVADNYGLIENCYASGPVSGSAKVGGLVGGNGNSDFPGARGEARGRIYRSYSCGLVTGTVSKGGLVGYNELGVVERSFWDEETSGLKTSSGGQGKTTADMQIGATFISVLWSLTDGANDRTCRIWRMCADHVDYPRLNWQFSQYGDFVCPNGVGLEDFSFLGGRWRTAEEVFLCAIKIFPEGDVGFADLMIFSEQWLTGR